MTEDTTPDPSMSSRNWSAAKAVFCVPFVSLVITAFLWWAMTRPGSPLPIPVTDLIMVGLLGPADVLRLGDVGLGVVQTTFACFVAMLPALIASQVGLLTLGRHRDLITAMGVLISGAAWAFLGFAVYGLRVT